MKYFINNVYGDGEKDREQTYGPGGKGRGRR